MKNTLLLGLLAFGLANTSLAFADTSTDIVCLRDGSASAPRSDGSCAPGSFKLNANAWRESGDEVAVRKNGNGILLEPATFDNRYTYLLVHDGGGIGAVKISTRRECDKLAAQYNGHCMTAADAKGEFARLKSAN
ncbi:hypothetical protein [Burkholderia gladioli]|uniref:hypothetical protein n=1 Tax=Burkholderia gladioli TaxID=28095 RepID=UPI0016411568|nr:hypothetical protein [Burkholderia gladioli]